MDTLLKEEEEIALSKEIIKHKGTPRAIEARNKMVSSNYGLVIYIAQKYKNKGLPYLDIIQEGNMGLIIASEHFDYRFGVRFSTYASYWIKQCIRLAIIKNKNMLQVPYHMYMKMLEWSKIEKYLQKMDINPTPENIIKYGEFTKWADSTVRFIVNNANNTHIPEYKDYDIISHDNIVDYDTYDAIMRFIETLPTRERDIIHLRLGLNGKEPKTLEEVGSIVGYTREWVRKIEKRVCKTIKEKYA